VTIAGAGTCTITASQAGNGNYAAATPVAQVLTVTAGAPQITLLPPGAQSVHIGQWNTFTAGVTSVNVNGPIHLVADLLPPGVAVAPVTIPAGASSAIVTITATSSAAPGLGSFRLTASGGGVSSSQTVPLTIPNFVISRSGLVGIVSGGSASTTVNVSGIGGYQGPVTLSYAEASGTLQVTGPASVSPGGTITVTLSDSGLSGDFRVARPAAVNAGGRMKPSDAAGSSVYTVSVTGTDSQGLISTVSFGALVGSASTIANSCGGSIGAVYAPTINSDLSLTGQMTGTFTSNVVNTAYTGWVTTISSPAITYNEHQGSGYPFPYALWPTAANPNPPAPASASQTDATATWTTAPEPFPGSSAYLFTATYTYQNPNCTIVLYSADPGALSADQHSVTYSGFYLVVHPGRHYTDRQLSESRFGDGGAEREPDDRRAGIRRHPNHYRRVGREQRCI